MKKFIPLLLLFVVTSAEAGNYKVINHNRRRSTGPVRIDSINQYGMFITQVGPNGTRYSTNVEFKSPTKPAPKKKASRPVTSNYMGGRASSEAVLKAHRGGK